MTDSLWEAAARLGGPVIEIAAGVVTVAALAAPWLPVCILLS